jgi:hypothetical protein
VTTKKASSELVMICRGTSVDPSSGPFVIGTPLPGLLGSAASVSASDAAQVAYAHWCSKRNFDQTGRRRGG